MSLDLSSSFHQFNIGMAKACKNGGFAFGEFRLDPEKKMLYRGEDEILLPPKVVETLIVLVENRGEIVSKAELMDKVWSDSIVEESNLAQHLYLLRKTLGELSNGRPVIETLRRRGYRFNPETRIIDSGDVKRAGPSATRQAASGQYEV
ncbi:MAG: transcriptional regulator, partial [Acidobacteria bacterium]|nr:transcriptional regulator [Acidobacteriota bacterium]